ncbi:MAG: TonB-dependent receptor [Acidobacteria bacterium]|nr:TonB-dependent receptor [Acidobacteriota bacterium]
MVLFSCSAVARTIDANDQSIKTLSLEELGKIEVTTQNKEPEQVWSTPAAISVLTQEDIRRIGATNIPELIRMLPGVFVGTVNSNQWAVGVRGFTSNFSKSLLVLIDGRSVYTPLFGGVYWHVQDLVIEDIDRIEVIRGPGGTIWGQNAVNGVINIITKKANKTQGVMTSQVAANLERYNGSLRIGGKAGEHFHYRLFGKGFLRDHEIHPDGDNYDEWHMMRAGFRTDYTPNEHDSFTLQGDIYHGTTPRRVGVTDTEDPVSGGDILARFSHDFSKGSNVFVQGYIDRTTRGGIVGGVYQNTFDIDGILKWHANDRNTVLVGAGYRNNPTVFRPHEPGVTFLPTDQNYLLYRTFIQDEIALMPDRLTFTAGMKAEHNPFTGWELQPSGRLLFRASEHQSYWASVSRAVRIPSQLEENFRLTAMLSPTLEFLVGGNKHFESETLLGYEAGYRQLLTSNFYIDVAGYFNQYKRLQGFLPMTLGVDDEVSPPIAAYKILYGNTTEGSTRGIEFAPDWKVNSRWRLNGSYSLLRFNLRARDGYSDPAAIRGYVGSSPLNQFSVQSRIDLWRSFEFDQTLRHVGSLPAQNVPSYTTSDLRMGWHHGSFDISVNGRDLLDNGHKEFGAGDDLVPTLGVRRSIFGKIVWTSKP